MDFILIGCKASLSQMIDLIITINLVQISLKSAKFWSGLDEFKVQEFITNQRIWSLGVNSARNTYRSAELNSQIYTEAPG